MDTVSLLEQVALSAYHYNGGSPLSLETQPTIIQEAFLTNNAKLLQSQISEIDSFAHESHVIQALIYNYNI